jgi:hypothetical protein
VASDVLQYSGMQTQTFTEPCSLNQSELLGKACETVLKQANSEGLPPQAEQFYLLAVGALEQAQRFAQLASYAEMQAR